MARDDSTIMEALNKLLARLFGPTCQAGGCDRLTDCYQVGECIREAEQQRHARAEARRVEREQIQAHKEADRRRRELEAEARADQRARERDVFKSTEEAGRKARLEAEARMTPEEREAARVRPRQGPRMRM